jgi:hypothetical protein
MTNRLYIQAFVALFALLLLTLCPKAHSAAWQSNSLKPDQLKPVRQARELGVSRISPIVSILSPAPYDPPPARPGAKASRRYKKSASILPLGYQHSQVVSYRLGKSRGMDQTWDLIMRMGSNPAFDEKIASEPGATMAGGLRYNHSKNLAIKGGLMGTYREMYSMLSPFVGIGFITGSKRNISGTLGFPFSKLTYHLDKKRSLSLKGGYEKRTYSLLDREGKNRDGYMEDSALMVGMDYTVNLGPYMTAGLALEYLFDREHIFYDAGGDMAKQREVENSLAALFNLKLRF